MWRAARRAAVAIALVALAAPALPARSTAAPAARAPQAPWGAGATVVRRGLAQPVDVTFAPDGALLVAEQSGLILQYDSLRDTTATVFADLRTEVDAAGERGLLGLAVDPRWPATRTVYALFDRDSATRGGPVPYRNDTCGNAGCGGWSRLARLTRRSNGTVIETPLIDGWCHQYANHSIGTVRFGTDGMLYAGSGDGASFLTVDYGETGSPSNACGDPPTAAGTAPSPPTAEGGSLRAQDARTTADPTDGDGAIIRVDPATGRAAPGNPYANDPDPMRARVLAYGLRNPYRFAFRPGTNELWIGDVGWNNAEEIDRVADTTSASPSNFGWPCFEGAAPQPQWQATGLDLCTTLDRAAVTAPAFTYTHTEAVVAGDGCSLQVNAITGLTFAAPSRYPAPFDRGMFFVDYGRRCIWFAPADASGAPDFSRRQLLIRLPGSAAPTDLELGPDGRLYYPDVAAGTIERVDWTDAPPVGTIQVSPARWRVGDTITVDAAAIDDHDGAEPPSALQLTATLSYCSSRGCFSRPLGSWNGVSTASFVAPDVAWRASITVTLRATDAAGHTSTTTTRVEPVLTTLQLRTSVAGTRVLVGGAPFVLPQDVPAIAGSHVRVQATTTANARGSVWRYRSWSDRGAASHVIVAPVSGRLALGVRWAALRPARYRLVALDGTSAFFSVLGRASIATVALSAPGLVVAGATTPDGKGFWRATSDGQVVASGTARSYGSLAGVRLRAPIVAMARTPTGRGYWLAAADGGVFTFGDARFAGSLGAIRLVAPIVAMARTPSGRGYWLAAADGGVFTFGDARFAGSFAGRGANIVAISGVGRGYVLLEANGMTHGFGGARPCRPVRFSPAVRAAAFVRTPTGQGCWISDTRGVVHPVGDAPSLGSLSNLGLRTVSLVLLS